MTIIDPSTNIGRLRLKLADWSDLVILPDSVYNQVLLDTNDNLNKATVILGSYILGILSQRTHRKLAQLESWSNEQFSQYLIYLEKIIKDPAYSGIAPIPYGATAETSPLIQFQETWRRNHYSGTEEQQSNSTAAYSPNDGSKFGPFGG
jgi:hypothetical protein